MASQAQSRDEASLVARRVRLMRNGILNYAASFTSGLVGLILVPILLQGLGAEAYGLWIAVMALVGSAAALDFGLNLTIRREIAGALGEGSHQQASQLVASAGIVYVATGLAGAAGIATVGLPLSGLLHLSPEARAISHVVFFWGGIYFFFQHLSSFAGYVLHGLQRLDLASVLTTATTIARAAGTIALIWSGAKLPAIAAWMAGMTAAGALASLVVVALVDSRYRLRLRFCWAVLRPGIAYSLTGTGTGLIMRMLID